MHTTICLTFLLFFTHNATPKIYVIDLTDDSHNDDSIKLHELLELFEKPAENRFKEIKHDQRILAKEIPADDDDCLSLPATKAETLKCLEELKKSRSKKSIGRDSMYYPGLYHEFYTQRPKRKIYSLYNYYGGLLKSKPSFTDLTREFSQDYLDVGELSRIESKCYNPDCPYESHDRNQKYKLRSKMSKLVGLKSQRRSIKRVEQMSDSSEESSDSSDSDKRDDKRDRKHRKPSRFQVVFNDDSSLESDEEIEKKKPHKSFSSESVESKKLKRESSSSDSDSVEVTEKPVKRKEKYSYLQGNNLYDSFRRRLQHFLPKRFHWDEDDIHHLGYYWFDGPRGKYS